MEIYRNNTAVIELKVPVTALSGTMEVVAKDGDTVLYTFPSATLVSGGYTVTLPFSLVDQDRTFTIEWEFDYNEGTTKTYRAKTYIEVVTPYVTLDEIKDALGDGVESFTDAQLQRAERKIRGVINNFTGQKFGRYNGTYRIQATGDSNLNLPARLISLEGVSGGYFIDVTSYDTRGDGWYLAGKTPVWDEGSYYTSGPITYPGSYSTRPLWNDNEWYVITGDWGYEDVPQDVKEAALILIEDMLCPDSEYRDRYVESVKTADFSYIYESGAYRGTGSVIADQLLEQYRRTNLVVI
jgi:hypothetical protein